MKTIRQAAKEDLARIAEIEIFNYRLNFYPIFQNDWFYFNELQVPRRIEEYLIQPDKLQNTFVYDDSVIKGFIQIDGHEVKKLFVEPILQGHGIGAHLLEYAIRERDATSLWALEKNQKAISFYRRHGFYPTGERKLEEDTAKYLVRLSRDSQNKK